MGVNWIIDGKINCQCILWIYWRLRGLTPITCDSKRQMDRIEEDSFFFIVCVCVCMLQCIRLTQIDIHQLISKLSSGVCLDRCSCKTRCYSEKCRYLWKSDVVQKPSLFRFTNQDNFSTQSDPSLFLFQNVGKEFFKNNFLFKF